MSLREIVFRRKIDCSRKFSHVARPEGSHCDKGYLLMDRAEIDQLSISQLRSLASRLKLSTSGNRGGILDRIVDFYTRHGWPEQLEMDQALETGSERGESAANVLETETRSSKYQGHREALLEVHKLRREQRSQ